VWLCSSEFLRIVPNQRVFTLDSEQSANMIQWAEQAPQRLKGLVKAHVGRLAITNDQYLNGFGVNIETEVVKVCFCVACSCRGLDSI
jgi:hypothetical protein